MQQDEPKNRFEEGPIALATSRLSMALVVGVGIEIGLFLTPGSDWLHPGLILLASVTQKGWVLGLFVDVVCYALVAFALMLVAVRQREAVWPKRNRG
jgi:hypothetical protein